MYQNLIFRFGFKNFNPSIIYANYSSLLFISIKTLKVSSFHKNNRNNNNNKNIRKTRNFSKLNFENCSIVKIVNLFSARQIEE